MVRDRENRQVLQMRSVIFVWLLALVAGGCSHEDSIVEPPATPPLPQGVTVVDNVVHWSTELSSRGSVRYGFAADALDHMAYPVAADRRDRELLTEHAVALLDVRAGQLVFLQTVNEASGHPTGYSEVGAFDPAVTPAADLLTATMIHIGFGDSHLITLPNGKRVLIDGGERAAAASVSQYLDQHGVGTLDAMLATHVHIDHMGGLVGDFGNPTDGLLARRPSVFFDSPAKSWSRGAYDEALATVVGAGARRVVLSRGQTSASAPDLAWDSRVQVVVLSSGRLPNYTPSAARENDDINNDSVVLRWSYGDVDFIIGGDAEAAAEASMLQAFPASELEVEYYKAHHHGLPDASTSAWVQALQPRVAFIPNTQLTFDGNLTSALARATADLTDLGAHIYAIDDAASLGRLRGSGIQYNITFATDGTSYEVRLERATQGVALVAKASCVHDDPDLRHLFETPDLAPTHDRWLEKPGGTMAAYLKGWAVP